MSRQKIRQILDAILVPFLAVISGLAVMGLLIIIAKKPVIESYQILIKFGFGCKDLAHCAFFTTLERSTPLILTGLSAVVAFRSGMFSIGQEGQFLMGSVMAAWLGYSIHLPNVIHPIVIILASMIAGAIYGWIPGVLRVRLGVNELLATIIMNGIAVTFTEYLVEYPMRADKSTTAYSPVIDQTAWLPSFFAGSKWGVGFIIAILAVLAVYFYLWRTKAGYEQRMAGQSKKFALFGGIPSNEAAIRAMVISGALAGLAGAVEVLGVQRRIMTGYSTGLGFDGLTAAILGQTHPIGVTVVAILFSGLKLGAQLGLQIKADIPRELGGTIIGFIILFVAARKIYENNIDRVRAFFTPRQGGGDKGYMDRLRGFFARGK
jgi:general nucleoside transport system permease protein